MAMEEVRHDRHGGRGERHRLRAGGDGGRGWSLSRALGWFSIGLGLAELAAPDAVARLAGVPDDDANLRTLRAFGLREVVGGVGILAQPDAAGWLWARVGGDLMDLAFLGNTARHDGARPERIAAAAAVVAGATALDLLCGQRLTRPQGLGPRAAPRHHDIHVRQTVAINRPPDEVYRFWRDLENLPSFLKHLKQVEARDDRRSHWVARAPAGRTVAWDSEITEDRPNERIVWRSLEGADIDNRGAVTFERATGGRGTILRVELRYRPPGGRMGRLLAALFGEEPGMQVRGDLRRLKQLLETGEVTVAEGSMSLTHPAQPWPDRQSHAHPHSTPAHS